MDGGILRCFLVQTLCVCVYIAPLTPALIVMRGSISQLAVVSIWISGFYLSHVSHVATVVKFSWKWVNRMHLMVFVEDI